MRRCGPGSPIPSARILRMRTHPARVHSRTNCASPDNSSTGRSGCTTTTSEITIRPADDMSSPIRSGCEAEVIRHTCMFWTARLRGKIRQDWLESAAAYSVHSQAVYLENDIATLSQMMELAMVCIRREDCQRECRGQT